MDKYDERGEAMCLTWTEAHRKVVAPVEIPCGMCQTFTAALRESAAEAYEDAVEHATEAGAIWLRAKIAALRTAGEKPR